MRALRLGLALAALSFPAAAQSPFPAGPYNQSGVALISATPPVTDNSDRIATTQWVNNFFALGIPLASGKIFIGSAGGLATAQTVSGDCTLAASGVITCTQSAGNFLVNGTLTVSGAVIDGSGILATNIAAPATPAAGTTRIYVDSSTKVLTFKNDAGTLGNAVVPSSASAHQWASAISTAGIITYTQPSFADLSGSATCAQEPARTGDVTAAAGSCANTAVKLNGVAFATAPSTDTVPVITAANTATYTAVPNCPSGALQYTTSTHLFNCGASSGSFPYFSAYPSAGTTVTSGTPGKMSINTKISDSNSWFDATTQFRYTPLQAGRYLVHVQVTCTGTTVSACVSQIQKNGSNYAQQQINNGTTSQGANATAIVTMNGTTDFLEAWITNVCTGTCSYAGGAGIFQTLFEASFIAP